MLLQLMKNYLQYMIGNTALENYTSDNATWISGEAEAVNGR